MRPRKVVTVPPKECGNYCPVIKGGEDPDPLIRQRRDKVKEVSRVGHLNTTGNPTSWLSGIGNHVLFPTASDLIFSQFLI